MLGQSKLRTKILSEFRLVANTIVHLLSDIDVSASKAVIYNFDYNLLYPWLWRQADQKDPHYDLIGRNIFALYRDYSKDTPFSVCFTVPSILELLDTIEHRHERSEAIANSGAEIDAMIGAFKATTSRDFDVESDAGRKVDRYLRMLPIGNDNTRLSQLLQEFRQGQIKIAHNLFDPEILKAASPAIRNDYSALYGKMTNRRSFGDTRREEDKLFHYRVDCWNIAFRLINEFARDIEISHICRHTIREFYPGSAAQFHSRHPIVPMYQLYALLAAPEGSTVKREALDFTVDALKSIKECIFFIEREQDEALSNISFYWREKIDNTYNRFIRPLFFDYSDDTRGINMKEYEHRRRQSRFGEYSSILTSSGFRDRFKQQAEALKTLATEVVELNPEITSERLLEEYDLSQNPRVAEIFKKFNLG